MLSIMLQVLILSLGVSLVLSAPAADEIKSLPGLATMTSFKQYSGYLDATDTKHFHYWFVESQGNPSEDPVVLWLNGGPGCSSLDGFLSENGPLHVNSDGKTLYSNPYSWNKIANVLYLESPEGVGYSYDDNGDMKTDDDKVSLHNYNAIVDFFKKFPEYSSNKFFVSGESYGGIYIPTLSVRIMQGAAKINFQGMAVGNGLSSFPYNDNSLIFFAYYHGLFGDVLWKSLTASCCDGGESRHACNFSSTANGCPDPVEEAFQYVYNSGLNEYALYMDCYGGDKGTLQRYHRDMSHLFPNMDKFVKYLIMDKKFSTKTNVGVVPPCINSTAQTVWLNREDVKQALHISPKALGTWAVCSDVVQYTTLYQSMLSHYQTLLKYSNFRILLYNGDTDMACNFLGDEWFVDDLKQPLVRSRAPWYVDGQVAGFRKKFKQITFTTIRGAGHMVPQWAPSYAFAMFDNFINDKPFLTK